jgi:phosphatidylcholine synthase
MTLGGLAGNAACASAVSPRALGLRSARPPGKNARAEFAARMMRCRKRRPAGFWPLPRRAASVGRMGLEQRHLFAIHLLTASGAALALLAVMAVAAEDLNTAFIWLGIALIIDGIDGPLARRYRVRERLPKWDGAALDNVVDYTSYVFVPALIAAKGLGLPPPWGALAGIIIATSGAFYYGDTRMKQPDNSFRGFPVVWNMVVFGLYALPPPWPVTFGIVVALAILTFVPINFVHPVRVMRWRAATLTIFVLWLLTCAWLIWTDFRVPVVVNLLLMLASAYLLCVSAVQQFLRSR